MDLPARPLEELMAEERATLAAMETLIAAAVCAPSPTVAHAGAGLAFRKTDGQFRERFGSLLAKCRTHFAEEDAYLSIPADSPQGEGAIAAHRYDHAVISNWLDAVERELADRRDGANPWPALIVLHSWIKDHIGHHDRILVGILGRPAGKD